MGVQEKGAKASGRIRGVDVTLSHATILDRLMATGDDERVAEPPWRC